MTSTIGYQKTVSPNLKKRKSSKLYNILLLNPTDADGNNANNQFTVPAPVYINIGKNTIVIDSTIADDASFINAEIHIAITVTAMQHIHPVTASTICKSSKLNDGKA